MRLQLKRSNVLASGVAKTPTASQLEYGELAINYNTDDPAIFLKDSNNNVIRISGVGNIADDGQVELPATTTPPSNPQSGNLWYNSDDGRLYIYYTDADSSQWVDASPDSWDPTVLPDTTNSSSQSGTLDDRYLMLNSGNDPVTGGLNITSGNVGIGTSNPDAKLVISEPVGSTTPAKMKFVNEGDRGVTVGFDDHNASPNFSIFNGDQTVEFVSIKPDGNVGIGTSSPSMLLDVRGANNPQVKVSATNTGTNSAGLFIENQGQRNWQIWADRSADQLKIGHNSRASTVLAITDSRVGIGSLSPIAQVTALGINSAGQGGTMCIQNTGTGVNTNVALYLCPNNGGGNDLQRTAAIKSRQDVAGNFANLEFYTSASSTPTERMRITSTGTLRIGQSTSDDPSGSDIRGVAIGNDYISCSGQNGNSAVFGRRGSDGSCVLFRRQTTNVGSISVNGSSTAYNTSSDHRLKENVVDLDGAITRVKQLAPKRFNFIADADTTVDGFLAHEAQTVVPEAVTGTHNQAEPIGTLTEWDGTVLETDVVEPNNLTWEETVTDEDGNESTDTRTRTWTQTGTQPVYQGIDQAKLVPLLTAALQEAIARIEALENA